MDALALCAVAEGGVVDGDRSHGTAHSTPSARRWQPASAVGGSTARPNWKSQNRRKQTASRQGRCQALNVCFRSSKAGSAARPLAAGNRVPASRCHWRCGCKSAGIRVKMRPRISGHSLLHDGIRRAGTARPTHPCTWEIARVSPGKSIRKIFSNHWKSGENFFQSLENFRRGGGQAIVQNPGRDGGRGDGASGPFSVTCRFFVL